LIFETDIEERSLVQILKIKMIDIHTMITPLEWMTVEKILIINVISKEMLVDLIKNYTFLNLKHFIFNRILEAM